MSVTVKRLIVDGLKKRNDIFYVEKMRYDLNLDFVSFLRKNELLK